jgi:hypothetical protein
MNKNNTVYFTGNNLIFILAPVAMMVVLVFSTH